MSEGTPAPEGETPEGEAPETPEAPSVEGLQKELDKWKTQARKNEERSKANAKAAGELEAFKRQSMSDQEKAVAEARDAGRTEALKDASVRLVAAEVRAAAKGRVADVEALLEGVDGTKFLNDDGDVDVDAISKWIDRIAPEPDEDEQPSPFPDIGQGARSGTKPHALGSDSLVDALKRTVGSR